MLNNKRQSSSATNNSNVNNNNRHGLSSSTKQQQDDSNDERLRKKIKSITKQQSSSDHHKRKHEPITKIHKDKLQKCYSSFKQVMQESNVEHYLSLGNHEPKENLIRFSTSELERVEHLHIYDFDGTLFETLLPEEGMELYGKVTGKSWPYGMSWWSRKESVSAFTFAKNDNNEHLVKDGEAFLPFLQAKKSQTQSDLIVMMTGRKNSLKREIIQFLEHRLGSEKLMPEVLCFKPDDFNNTIGFKVKQIYSFSNSLPNLKRITMWEDRVEHATRFQKMEIKNFILNSPVSMTVQLVGKEKDEMNMVDE